MGSAHTVWGMAWGKGGKGSTLHALLAVKHAYRVKIQDVIVVMVINLSAMFSGLSQLCMPQHQHADCIVGCAT